MPKLFTEYKFNKVRRNIECRENHKTRSNTTTRQHEAPLSLRLDGRHAKSDLEPRIDLSARMHVKVPT